MINKKNKYFKKGFVIILYTLGINVKSNFSSPVLSKAYDQPPVSGKQIDR